MNKCSCTTLKGTKCKNNALEGSAFCKIHQNCERAPNVVKAKASKTKVSKTKVSKTKAPKVSKTKISKASKSIAKSPKAVKKVATRGKIVKFASPEVIGETSVGTPSPLPKKKSVKNPSKKAVKKLAKSSPPKGTKTWITGRKDMDALILSTMDTETFWKTCQTNASIRKLCSENSALADKYFKLRVMAQLLGFLKKYKVGEGKFKKSGVLNARFVPEIGGDDYDEEYDDSPVLYINAQGITVPRPETYKFVGQPTRRIHISHKFDYDEIEEVGEFVAQLARFFAKNKIAAEIINEVADYHVVISVFFDKDARSLKELMEEVKEG